MTSIVPELDDIVFDRLVEDGRGLIPRYAPDWTDHNLHDPGITLIDLIAFLVDRQVYRIGFVGDSLQAAFTRLMGIAPRGPVAPEMLVWPGAGVPLRDFAAGAEIRSRDEPDAQYTLSADVRTVAARISGIALWQDGARRRLGTGLTEGRDPVELPPAAGGGPQMLELELSEPVAALAGAGAVSLGVGLAAVAGDAAWDSVVLEQWDPGGFWRPLETEDRTGGLRRSGVILFRPDPAAPAERLRLRLDRGFRPGTVRLERLGLNVLPAREGRDDPGGRIGEGTGLPDQAVEIDTDSIVDRDNALVVTTVEGATEIRWERRDDLTTSGPGEAHYRLTPGGIAFGNGLNGRVVPAGAQIRIDPVRRTDGARGAVAEGLEWSVAGLTYGSNFAPSTPGRNRDGLTELIDRARALSRQREGVLGAEALRDRLLAAGLGLRDVQVRPRRRPGFDGAAPGNRTVVYLPDRDPETRPATARTRLRDEVEAAVAPLRLLGERLHVSAPINVPVDVAVTLAVAGDADAEAVRDEALALLRARLWDLRRRPDIDPWPAGRDVTVGEVEGLLARIVTVVRVPACRIARSGEALSPEPITLRDREIALADSIAITVEREGGTP